MTKFDKAVSAAFTGEESEVVIGDNNTIRENVVINRGTHTKTGSGYVSESARYQARRCQGCPLRGSCFKAKGDRIIEVNHRLNEYRRKARERLTSEEGVRHRGQRCIEPEAVFGQMKYDMAYKRFRHFGMDALVYLLQEVSYLCQIPEAQAVQRLPYHL